MPHDLTDKEQRSSQQDGSISRERRLRRGENREDRNRRRREESFGRQRMFTFSLLSMVVIIVEFQGIYEARLQHYALQDLHKQEQSTLHMIEKDLQSVVNQTSSAWLRSLPPTSFPARLSPTAHLLQQELPLGTHIHQNASIEPILLHKVNTETLIIFAKVFKSKWNLPPPSDKRHLIPSTLENLADLSDPYTKDNIEVPFFWHIAKSGGTSVKHMYSDCYRLVEACESGVSEGHIRDITLKVVTLESGWRYLNVDTTTPDGIERASRFNMIRARKADLIVSPLPHEVAPKLFVKGHKGRCFAIFRDPLERVASLFYYLQNATHEPTYNPALRNMTFEEYVFSDLAESDFISRTLIDKMEAPLEEQDFEILKEILKTKCLVGMLEKLEESLRRFDLYFEFGDQVPNATCVKRYLTKGTNRHPNRPAVPPPDSDVFRKLEEKNHMDTRLYEYVRQLFAEQASIFTTNPVFNATVNATDNSS